MSELPGDLLFTKDHEWLRREADGGVTIGITEHAATALGDLVYVELPEVGQSVEAGGDMAVVESVKAASDVYAPVSGEVTEINDALESEPGTVNEDPYGDGWFYRIRLSNADEIEDLLSPEDYAEQVNI